MTRPLNIGIDIRNLKAAATGQKTYLEELCRELKLLEDSHCRFFFFDTWIPVYSGKNKLLKLFEHFNLQCWKQVSLPLKAWSKKTDIIFCIDYFAPYLHLGYQTVEVFHDAFFYEYPQHYNRIWLKLFKLTAIPAARRSACIVVPSYYARQRIHHYTKIPLEKIVTIYEGPKTLHNRQATAALPSWLPVHQHFRYILHVGVMEKRKNLPALIRAFKQLRDHGYEQYKLVLVGKGDGKMHSDDTAQIMAAIREHQLENEVITPGYLPDDQLGMVYQHAALYIFPSVNEGFGIPILEAFSYQVPVLVANNTCLPEIGGPAVLTFDPYDTADMVSKMRMVIDNEALRTDLVQKGTERLRQFSWKIAAQELVALFKKLRSS